MEPTDFLSDGTYVPLPTASNPKVYLPLGFKKRTEKAFQLYNPFSAKARILKKVARCGFRYAGPFARAVLPTIKSRRSPLVAFLEERLQKKILTSLYLATAGDKVVLQLQDAEKVIGYLKYPVTEIGKKRLITEREALSTLEQVTDVPKLLLSDTYESVPFILLENIMGTISQVSPKERSAILRQLEKNKVFELSSHPRIKSLQSRLTAMGKTSLAGQLQLLATTSVQKYKEVYEHGDFAPWNLIRTATRTVAFDFEYFEEKGLQYLDEIKFHFQEQRLLEGKNGDNLVNTIRSKVSIEEFDLFFRIFLIKELCRLYEDGENALLEENLISILGEYKPVV